MVVESSQPRGRPRPHQFGGASQVTSSQLLPFPSLWASTLGNRLKLKFQPRCDKDGGKRHCGCWRVTALQRSVCSVWTTPDCSSATTGGRVRRDLDSAHSLRDSMVDELMRGLPHSLLLENRQRELFVMVSRTDDTGSSRDADSQHFGDASHHPAMPLQHGVGVCAHCWQARANSDVWQVLDRGDVDWLQCMTQGETPFYLYPVHVSHTFLTTPTQVPQCCLRVCVLTRRCRARQCTLGCSACCTDSTWKPTVCCSPSKQT